MLDFDDNLEERLERMNGRFDEPTNSNSKHRNNDIPVQNGDILKDGDGNEYTVLIDQRGHAELRRNKQGDGE